MIPPSPMEYQSWCTTIQFNYIQSIKVPNMSNERALIRVHGIVAAEVKAMAMWRDASEQYRCAIELYSLYGAWVPIY